MITYNPHQPRSFFRVTGSVLPKAFLWGCVSSSVAILMKFLDYHNVIDVSHWSFFKGNSVYEGFTFVLGFVVVFRASQSYTRYWQAATAVHEMRTQWYEATANLVSFAQISPESKELVNEFQHVVIRLFTLLHAMAMEEIAHLLDQEFPPLDIEGLQSDDLRVLTLPAVQGRKVEVVSQWLKIHILQALNSGVLSVPAPILTRVFQNLGMGMVKHHEALQVVIWPFPFPYAQISFVLIACHGMLTPMFLVQTFTNTAACSIFTLISVMCVKSIDLTAAELENPFGDDDNDLPILEMHHELIQDTLLLTNPCTLRVPRLVPGALMDHEDLVAAGEGHRLSLNRSRSRGKAVERIVRSIGMSNVFTSRSSNWSAQSDSSKSSVGKWAKQLQWVQQVSPEKGKQLAKVLRLDEHGQRRLKTSATCDVVGSASAITSHVTFVSDGDVSAQPLPDDGHGNIFLPAFQESQGLQRDGDRVPDMSTSARLNVATQRTCSLESEIAV